MIPLLHLLLIITPHSIFINIMHDTAYDTFIVCSIKSMCIWAVELELVK
jgi:hypothetical protein